MARRKPPRPPRPSRPPASAGNRPDSRRHSGPRRDPGPAGLWLYGVHAVFEALANPRRRFASLLIAAEAAAKLAGRLEPLLARRRDGLRPEAVPRERLAELLPDGAVHQGLAARAEPLVQPDLADLLEHLPTPGAGQPPQVVVALDQITDPQNVGAILRSAAAFGAAAVVTTKRHAAPESGALAKAASGALEHLAYLQEVNLARALGRLRTAGFQVLGLAAEGAMPIAAAEPGTRVVLALGAEGTGLRRLTRERCDLLVRLPTRGPIGQLNVSNAAAVALYELLGRRGRS